MTAPLRLEPSFQRRLWGGRRLESTFGYDLPDGPIGECWGISAHPNGPSTVRGGPHDGRSLADVWEADREFFGEPAGGEFPLLVKFLDARDWLSVQVHPDDDQAARIGGDARGKTEGWYVVAATPGAQLIVGHRARSAAELAARIDAGRWDELLLRREVAAGDFVYVPSGTLHSLGAGVLVCEVQQSSDTTYRVYDFDRIEPDGSRRPLHLDRVKEVTTAPYDPATTETAGPLESLVGGRRRQLVQGPYFEATLHDVEGTDYRLTAATYQLVTVIQGAGALSYDGGGSHDLRAGDHLVLPADAGEVTLSGGMTVLTARPA